MGNIRKAINEKTIGIPVISVGIPTVVDSATLVLDTLERAGKEQIEEGLFNVLREAKSFFVMPKDIDEITKNASVLIAKALNKTFGIDS